MNPYSRNVAPGAAASDTPATYAARRAAGIDTVQGVRRTLAHGLPELVGYLDAQMQAGRLRRLEPVVAFQLLAGPIAVHLLTRPLAESLLGLRTPTDEVVDQIVAAWLRAMAPEGPEQGPSTGRRRRTPE